MTDTNTSMAIQGTGSSAEQHITIEQGLLALGLPQYIEPCRETGLSSWATLSQLSESDFESLGVSLGHRRKLQRAFAQQHSWPDYLALPTPKEIKGFRSFPFESESSGSDDSITPQSPRARNSSPPSPAGVQVAHQQLNGAMQSGMESRRRPIRTDELESSVSTSTKPA